MLQERFKEVTFQTGLSRFQLCFMLNFKISNQSFKVGGGGGGGGGGGTLESF